MRVQWRQALRLLSAGGLWLVGSTSAFADTSLRDLWPWSDRDARQEPAARAPLDWLSGGYRPEQALYFGGFDLHRYGFGAYVGAVWSPAPGRDGMLVRLFASDGIDVYRATNAIYRSQTLRAALTPGYRISRPGFELSAYAGVDILARMALPLTKKTRIEPDIGMRLATDIWWEPVNAVMIAANLSMTTIDASFYARLATGIRMLDVWTGPEISASQDVFQRQYRIGAHLTGLRTANYEFSVAAGYAIDSFGRSGSYGRFGLTLREFDPITIMP